MFISNLASHYSDVIMTEMTSQITSLTVIYSTVYSVKKKHQSSASLAFVRGIHWWPVNSPHKGPVTQKMSPFDDVIMYPWGKFNSPRFVGFIGTNTNIFVVPSRNCIYVTSSCVLEAFDYMHCLAWKCWIQNPIGCIKLVLRLCVPSTA